MYLFNWEPCFVYIISYIIFYNYISFDSIVAVYMSVTYVAEVRFLIETFSIFFYMSFIKNTKFYKQHPFHIISPTFGPFALAITVWNVLFFFNLYLNVKFTIMPSYCPIKPLTMIYFGITLVLCALYRWGEDISNDAVKGNHTTAIQDGLRVGFILFIISEILLFFSIFWAFAHFSLMPSIWIGSIWPPEGINVLNPVDTPLLNTVILLSSGVFTVWAHHSFIVGDRQTVMFALLLTCLLGLYFSWLQFLEYSLTDFTISDSVYGSIFFFFYRFSWCSCYGWYSITMNCPLSYSKYVSFKRTLFRFWICCMILTFYRCCLNFFIYFIILMGGSKIIKKM